ncbi:unnamed protein product [marine sediment metagenome]|uniref:Uncharacterized protein n=1 Tax=marine sediment metagenome TaxID=412755 RepID=X1K7R7_9ZZZZ
MKDHMVVKGKDLSDWSKRQVKEKIRRYCRSNNIDLLVYTSE